MKEKVKMTRREYKKYMRDVNFYNSTLEIGITKCFTNKILWYRCDSCSFISKQKHDARRHYERIHIKKGISTPQKSVLWLKMGDFAEKLRKNDKK